MLYALTQWVKLGFDCGFPSSINHLWPIMTCRIAHTFNPLIIENSSVSDGFRSLSKFEISEKGLKIFSNKIEKYD